MGSTASTPTPPPAKSLLEDHHLSPSDLAAAYGSSHPSASSTSTIPLALPSDELNSGQHPTHKAGKFLALDCEMVGTGPPPSLDSLLARVSIVNYHYEQIYDAYVQPPPRIKVTDYRTAVSGIRPEHLSASVAKTFAQVQKEVAGLLRDRVLVGHALKNDLAVLGFGHPRREMRDTSHWKGFRTNGGAPRLRDLARRELGVEIQGGSHSSLEDARAAMGLFRKVKGEWEVEVRRKFGAPRGGVGSGRGAKGRGGRVVNEEEEGEDGEDEEDGEEVEEDGDDGWDVLDGEEDEVDEAQDTPAKGRTTQAKKKKKKGKTKKRTKRK